MPQEIRGGLPHGRAQHCPIWGENYPVEKNRIELILAECSERPRSLPGKDNSCARGEEKATIAARAPNAIALKKKRPY